MDRELVERAQRGDRDAYEALATAVADRLYATAYRMVEESDAAHDATQLALVSIWTDLPSLRDPDRFESWAYRLVVRECLTDLRRRRRRPVVQLPREALVVDPVDVSAGVAARDQVERALTTLTPEQRAVVVLHYFADLSLGDIAEILDVPYGTVGSRMHHAMRSLRAAIEAADRPAGTGEQIA